VRSVGVTAVDEGVDLGVEAPGGREHPAAEGLAFDDAEPDLDEVIQEAWVAVKCTTTRG
jgi:hypothetical protein